MKRYCSSLQFLEHGWFVELAWVDIGRDCDEVIPGSQSRETERAVSARSGHLNATDCRNPVTRIGCKDHDGVARGYLALRVQKRSAYIRRSIRQGHDNIV